jgi:hypothetical protein
LLNIWKNSPSFETSKLIHKIKIKIKKSPWSPYLPLPDKFLVKGKYGSNLSIWRARLIIALHGSSPSC